MPHLFHECKSRVVAPFDKHDVLLLCVITNSGENRQAVGTPVSRKNRAELSPDSVISSNWSPTEVLTHTQIKKKATTLFVPTIDYITISEFENVPKYDFNFFFC